MSADKLVATYVKIRERRREIAKEDKDLSDKLSVIELALLEIFNETGTESLRTNHGTAMKSISTRSWTTDWEAFFEFMKEHDVMLVQRRIAEKDLAQFMEENPDLTPPGLQTESQYKVNVRMK